MKPKETNNNILSSLTIWQVLESLGESVAVVDRDYRLIWVRDPFMTPAAKAAIDMGDYCYSVFVGRDDPCEKDCPVAVVFATGRPSTIEKSFIGPDGTERWRAARAFPIVDGSGRVAFVARVGFDITRRKQKQARKIREYENLAQSLDELNQLHLHQMPFQPTNSAPLTKRELEVLRLMAKGLSTPQIAEVLKVSSNTAKRHTANIFDKLGVNNRAQASAWAAKQGLV
jgi:DNA-binding CsgD family transcriptional regulator